MTIRYAPYVANKDGEVVVASPMVLDARADFARALAMQLSVQGCKSNGVDAEGRPKLYPLTPGETVKRAIETADALFAALEAKGWSGPLPSPFPEAPAP